MNVSESLTTSQTSLDFDGVPITHPSGLLSDHIRGILEPAIIHTRLIVNIIGVITNTINIRVFLEQGVRNDSTNIAFVLLSVSDLLICVTLIPFDCCFLIKYTHGIAVHYSCLAFSTIGVHIHGIFINMSRWTTVYISLMRCLCVIFPLKVKSLLTPTFTVGVITCLFICFGSFQLWTCASATIVWEHTPVFNATIAYFRESKTSQILFYYKLLIMNQILPVLAIVIVSVNTALMGRKLIEVNKWRHTNSNIPDMDGQQDDKPKANSKQMSSKEIHLIKFINTIACIFIVCGFLGIVPTILRMSVPGVNFAGINKNLFYVAFGARSLLDVANASINFFFYIRVSSRYKTAFQASFNTCLKQDVQNMN